MSPVAMGSPTTVASRAFVDERLAAAADLGRALAAEIDDPGAFVEHCRAGLAELADAAYEAGTRRVAPGIGPVLGVRLPLLERVHRSLRRELRGIRPARQLGVAEALATSDLRELRWFATWMLAWTVQDEPERSWQVLRRIGREADDWITVDTLAAAIGPAILREPFRWAELHQLVFSPSRWERRLVGSTVATIPFGKHAAGRTPEVAGHGLELVGQLIGDAEPDVQKALSWALRSLVLADRPAVVAFCRAEAARAAAARDGSRAWVLRDALAKLPTGDAMAIRAELDGIRRRPGSPSTSIAADTAAAFLERGLAPAGDVAASGAADEAAALPTRRPTS